MSPLRQSHASPRRGVATGGFTLIELLISIVVFGFLVAGALGFLSAQNNAFHRGAERMTSLQNLRYTFQILETDVRTLGTNLPPDQPPLVLAGEDVIAFSADYATNVANDLFAVFHTPGAPAGEVSAPTSPVALPNSGGLSFPSVVYRTQAGTVSPGELIIFFFRPDSTTERTDDYILLRQVNHLEPEVVSRNLLRVGSEPFFRYFHRRDFPSAPSVIDSVPPARLPLFHSADHHGSPEDVGDSALADSIRAVRVTLAATNGLEGEREHVTEYTRVIRMPNAGQALLQTCGDEPIMGGSLGALVQLDPGTGEPLVRLTWSPAVDESGGERDVIRYVLWRRVGGAGDWGDPYLSIPAGQPSYLYEDGDVVPGASYQYALAAQDCTPSLSGLVTSALVNVPN